MGFFDHFQKQKVIDLLIGIVGINVTFVISGVLFEWMTKLPYMNVVTNQSELFRSAVGLIAIERGVVWMLAEIYNHFTIAEENRVKMPSKNVAICGFIIFFSSITNTEAIYMVSFPLTIMVKSCNILSVILVGVLCSRVRSKQLKLGPKKVVVAIFVSVGIVLFRFFDPEVDFSNDGKKTQLFGLLLLLASLLSDGFLPDFQAQIKQKYKPGPTEMMLEVNKWSFIFCLIYAVVINHFFYTLQFCWEHPLFIIHLLSMSVQTFFGQIFVYRLIKQFKQHIVPFVVTTRKIITVGFSLIYFNHKSSFGQIIGIIMVFCVTSYEFLSQMLKSQGGSDQAIAIHQSQSQISTSLTQNEDNNQDTELQESDRINSPTQRRTRSDEEAPKSMLKQ